MKKIRFKLFGRIFMYTLFFLGAAIVVFTFFYARQLEIAFALYERRQLTYEIQTLLLSLEEKTQAEKIEAVSDFGMSHKTFAFSVRTNGGEILYETPDFYMNETTLKDLLKKDDIALENIRDFDFVFSLSVDDNATLYIARYADSGSGGGAGGIVPLSLILLGISVAGAFLFARMMSAPIKRLARDTVKMSDLESVEEPPPRSDEIGLLSDNVHSMYRHLKTAIAELEDEIKAGRELEEKQRYFFSAASHELKTPVAAVSAIMEALIGKVIDEEDYPEYFHKCLQMMKTQGKLIAEILEIARLNENAYAPEKKTLSLSLMVEAVLPSYRALSESKNQKIKLSLPGGLTCEGDEYMLDRVLSNVIMNAVQNTPEGGEIRIWSEPPAENTVRLCVLNTGAHIGAEVVSKICEPFYRADKSRGGSEGNGGLGLTIVKKALDIMEIPFAIENSEEGVLFWMDLPI